MILSIFYYGTHSLRMSLLNLGKKPMLVNFIKFSFHFLRGFVGDTWSSRETFSRLECSQVNCVIMNKRFNCQAPSQIPNPQGPAPTQSNPIQIPNPRTGADTKILWATTHPTHPQLLSMKEASNKKTQRVKVT